MNRIDNSTRVIVSLAGMAEFLAARLGTLIRATKEFALCAE